MYNRQARRLGAVLFAEDIPPYKQFTLAELLRVEREIAESPRELTSRHHQLSTA